LHTSVDGVDWPLDSAERIDKAAVKMKAVNKVNAESMSTYVAAMEEKHAAMAVEKAARDAKHRKEIRGKADTQQFSPIRVFPHPL